MSTPSKTDNFDILIKTLTSMKRYHSEVTDVGEYYNKAEHLIKAYRKPSASTLFSTAMNITKAVASRNPMGKFIFAVLGPGLKTLKSTIRKVEQFEKLTNQMDSFMRSLEELEKLKVRYLKDFRWVHRKHGSEIVSYYEIHEELFSKTKDSLVDEHLEAMETHVERIVSSMDHFLWYYVRIKPHYKKFYRAMKEYRGNSPGVFESKAYSDFQLSVVYKMETRRYGQSSKVGQLISLRNKWANWIDRPSVTRLTYLNGSHRAMTKRLARQLKYFRRRLSATN